MDSTSLWKSMVSEEIIVIFEITSNQAHFVSNVNLTTDIHVYRDLYRC